MARAAGHEVMLEAPMEPSDYPTNDPGPYTLLADSQPPETVRRLEWLLSRASGYFGGTNYLGARFVSAPSATSGTATPVMVFRQAARSAAACCSTGKAPVPRTI